MRRRRRPWAGGLARECLWVREKGRERPEGPIPPFDLGTGNPQSGDSRRRRSVDGGGHGGAVVGVDGGRGWGQEGEGIVEVRFPPYLGPRWSREVGTRR